MGDYSKIGISELERLVRHHNHLYFIEKKPEISDYEFDLLVEALRKRKPASKILKEIGSDLTDASQKVHHDTPMLSLDKAYDQETMDNWAGKFSGGIVVSPKVDGCAVSIKYDKGGVLSLAATRGNGVEGELITDNALEVGDIPKKINLSMVEIRGEIYMSLSTFKKYSSDFANPRNLAAGAIKQKDPKKTAEYNLSFWGYEILGVDVATEAAKLELLKKNGFPTLEWHLIETGDIQAFFNKFFTKRDKFDFETDGVVYKTNDTGEQRRLGVTAHHPRYAIAYKFQGDSGETHILDVEWSVARSGVITPVGIVEPVKLSGATVTRASLHNLGMMSQLGLTKGARVLMTRRGGVIPKLEEVIKDGKGRFNPPSKCPSCGAATEMRDDFLYCTNPRGCMKTKMAELEHFIKTIECDGFGVKLIEQLYDKGLVLDPADFYRLTKADLLVLERMGDVLAEKLVRNINVKRELTLDVFLRSLGIREFGRHVAEILADRCKNIDEVFAISKEELASIHTIGDVIAEHVAHGLKEKRVLINKLLKEIKIKDAGSGLKKGPLSGKRVLFTGSLVAMERKAAQNLVKELGGSIATSISKDVDYLVVGDGGGAGSKLDKAEKLVAAGAGIKIVGEGEFLKMVK